MRSLIAALALLSLAACGPADPDGEACIVERFEAQPSTRFPLGETYWLPTLTDDCAGAWTVTQAPKASGRKSRGPALPKVDADLVRSQIANAVDLVRKARKRIGK
mgnify:CR=1 FL=1